VTASYRAAVRHLARIDADWARLIKQVGPCKHEPIPAREPYEALIRAIAYQQLHVRAGDAILKRMLALYPGGKFPKPEKIVATEVATLRACGFSTRKVETILAIAAQTLTGVVPNRAAAERLDDEALIERLVTLRGVGRWTVEMFLIYSLARMDILPVDDFGVRDGYRRLKALDVAPGPKALAKLGEAWSPHRTIAAWYLWRVPR
jgi:DNA-3-methyladenine glycosylase II